jgi:hypothetical protein
MAEPAIFDLASAQKLVAAYRQLRLELTNVQRQLRAIGVTHQQPMSIAGLGLARLTSTIDDDNPVGEAHRWILPKADGEYTETSRELHLRCFLRPEGETIEERTRVIYAPVGKVNEIIVVGCAPDPEEEEEPPP